MSSIVKLCPVCGFPLEGYREIEETSLGYGELVYFDDRSEVDRLLGAPPPRPRRKIIHNYEFVDKARCPRCNSKTFWFRKPEDVSDSTDFINKNQYRLVETKYYCTICNKEVSHSAVKIIFPNGKFAFIDVLYCPACEKRPEPIKKQEEK